MRTKQQKGSLKRVRRPGGSEVWILRWREAQADGSRKPRKVVIGSVKDIRSESAAWLRVQHLGYGLTVELVGTPRPKTFGKLIEHFTEKELPELDDPQEEGRSFSTKHIYRGYLDKRIVPRWGNLPLELIKAVAVEDWLRSMKLEPTKANPEGKRASRGTRKKIRDIMHVIFEHAIRFEWTDTNPITSVRQSGKREGTPDILEVEELVALLNALELRERVAVFLDFGIGARRGELQGLKWSDFDFEKAVLRLQRSIVLQHVGKLKTEASEKPIPLSPSLIGDLQIWRQETPYAKDSDYVFASPFKKGTQPYWMSQIMQHIIKPVAAKIGIKKRISWHTLRRTYASLLQDHNEDPKVVQELLRHANFSITMNIYTQAMTGKKRRAQSNVVEMVAGKRRIDNAVEVPALEVAPAEASN